MNIVAGSKINRLLMNTDPNGLLFSSWLKTQGYSDQLQKQYRASGWFTSLSQGVMYRTGSKLSAYSALANCNLQTGARYCIAAHSALEYTGFNHYVPMGKPTLTVALHPTRKLIRIMPSVYKIKDFAVHGGTAINLFHKNMPRYSVVIDLT